MKSSEALTLLATRVAENWRRGDEMPPIHGGPKHGCILHHLSEVLGIPRVGGLLDYCALAETNEVEILGACVPPENWEAPFITRASEALWHFNDGSTQMQVLDLVHEAAALAKHLEMDS